MTSKPVALLLADLGVTKTHSRPHVSNDNPYSESQFVGTVKAMKYRRLHRTDFFRWDNAEHRHWGLGMLTPHLGLVVCLPTRPRCGIRDGNSRAEMRPPLTTLGLAAAHHRNEADKACAE